ncbi:MAG: ATP-binding cassette domain-containing protein [Proteobacteria bacterium]|nr:ATP-binding cassette domain-containing protein [Pseudomonadota bacterium]
MTLLSVANVSKEFTSEDQSTLAIKRVSFQVGERDFLSIIGPSGCGKTTLLMIVSGLLSPTTGEITLKGHQVSSPPPGLILLFQDYSRSLMPWRRVFSNVRFGLDLRRQQHQFRGQDLRKQAEKYLEAVGLLKFQNHYPWQLSGGMQQRVAIARALACEPTLLVMDEPFGSLDAQTRAELEDLLLEVWEQFEQTIIFVTHDIEEGIYLSDRVIVLTASPAEILKEFRIDLPRPRNQIETRSDPNFLTIRNKIHKMIIHDTAGSGYQNHVGAQ